MREPPTRYLPTELPGARASVPGRAGGAPPGGVGRGGWWRAVLATCGQLLRRPGDSFTGVPDSIAHPRVLGFVASLRLPLWAVLLAVLLVTRLVRSDPDPWSPTALGQFLDVALVEALSLWLLLLVPIGIPLLYFLGGIFAHAALGLTGGARQSIGASMRAFGYTAAPAWLIISALDLALYLGVFSDRKPYGASVDGPELYAIVLGAVLSVHYVLLSLALARTHQIGLARSLLTALLPLAVFAGATFGRASLELERFPFVPRSEPSPYAPILLDGPFE